MSKPGAKERAPFASLSVSGGIVDAQPSLAAERSSSAVFRWHPDFGC
ncbi:MAG: hypothetical protein H0V44_12235 [Planctomycetes bacterium]|nr:hypothetical protein [Planctomycetota bacterium]